MLQDLQDDCAAVNAAPEELIHAIHTAQTSMHAACQKVATWFRLSKSDAFVSFSLDLAIEIAAESVRNCFGRSNLITHVAGPTLPLIDGKYLLGFVDMFFILFENALTRSGVSPTTVDVQFQRNGSLLTISLSNEIGGGINRRDLADRISAIKQAYGSAMTMGQLASEGGTGFVKLRKILAGDLACLSDFDLYVDGSRFSVVIVLEIAAWE